MTAEHVLLVATVGGTPEPIAVALAHWRPARALFVPSAATEGTVALALESCASDGFSVPPGAYDVEVVSDPQDLTACLHALRRLEPTVNRWLERGEGYAVAVDYTGGTKTMSAALALWARRWPCFFSYVGGSERTAGGMGVVRRGSESTLIARNPWSALGYQAVEDACAAFDAANFGVAAALLAGARNAASEKRVKRELSALLRVVEAYSLWDRFDHRRALDGLGGLGDVENDLHAALGSGTATRLLACVSEHRQYLGGLVGATGETLLLVADLLANAVRRRREKRFDDATARLYRATEAIAQIRLREAYGIDSGAVPVEVLDETLRGEWSPRAANGKLKLGLQEAFRLLGSRGDPLGARFEALGLGGETSPLTARNRSVLAHGWQAISERACDALWKDVLSLAEIQEKDLPRFPHLGRLGEAD
jgi:CRISPR-associated protein (TIGR02710 family)